MNWAKMRKDASIRSYMKNIILTTSILGLGLLQSCASGPDLSRAEVRESVAKVQLYEQKDLQGKSFEKVGSVEAKICQTNNFSSANSSEEGAKTELKFEASKLGANGIMNYLCHTKGMDWGSNCNSATVCYADAILIK